MKSVDVRWPVLFILSILSYPCFAESGSEYGDIIKDSSEYKKITTEKEKQKKKKRPTFYHDHHYHYPYPRPVVRYYDSAGSGSTGLAGSLYVGVLIGESRFDYNDIDEGDASIFHIGYRSEDSRLGFELSIYDSGVAEVTSLDDIDFEVETINLVLTVNSSKKRESGLNLVGKAGIYFADSTLSGPFDSVSESSNGFLLGVGAELALTRHFSLRADVYVLSDVEDFANDEPVEIVSLGGSFYF